jgi:hypothetical protein
MEPDPRLIALLRARDEQLRQTPLSLSADLRVRRMLYEAATRLVPVRQMRVAPAYVALGAAIALIVQAARDWMATGRTTAVADQTLAPTSPPADCTVRNGQDGALFSGRCLLELPTASIRTEADTEIRQTATHLEMVRGKAWFDVAPVAPASPPVRVRVAGGVIEVIGTRFLVEQGPKEGSVHLVEGKIRFTAAAGSTAVIRPGERFQWSNAPNLPLTEPPPPSVAPNPTASASPTRPAGEPHPMRTTARETPLTRAPRRAAPIASDNPREEARPDELLARDAVERVISLRARGRYRDAMAVLQALHHLHLDARTAEVLSFEEGNILEHLDDAAATCRHWRRHLARFASGPYGEFVEKKIVELSCQ